MQSAEQSMDILVEKREQSYGQHPLAICQPIFFSEEMLSKFDWSPTAMIYLQAFKLVKEGFKILHESNFTDVKGISLIAYGYLTENSILQAFPLERPLLSKIFHLCEKNLTTNAHFFEGVLLSCALCHFQPNISVESSKIEMKRATCLLNLIHFIRKAEPNSSPCKNPFEFDKNYSSWLHVLYWILASTYVICGALEKAAQASENSLLCCPSYYPSKQLLGYALMILSYPEEDDSKAEIFPELVPIDADKRQMTKYASWTTSMLRNTASKVLNEYLVEAPSCNKSYPNVYYYLARLAFTDQHTEEFQKYYELGQDAEEKRLPFFDPVRLPLKDWMTPVYQVLPEIGTVANCGHKACTKKVKDIKLKSCGACGVQQYCSKYVQMYNQQIQYLCKRCSFSGFHAAI